MNKPKHLVDIYIKEDAGFKRDFEPMTIGVPFPKGRLFENYLKNNALVYTTDDHQENRAAVTVLSKWNDQSIKWGLFDFQISLQAGEEKKSKFYIRDDKQLSQEDSHTPIKIQEKPNFFYIDTGKAKFEIDRKIFFPFKQILLEDETILKEKGSDVCLIDDKEKKWKPFIEKCNIERRTSLRIVLFFSGGFTLKENIHPLKYSSRLYFYANKSHVRVDFTIHNPNAALHPRGLWDLGDPASVLFQALSISLFSKDSDNPVSALYQLVEDHKNESNDNNYAIHSYHFSNEKDKFILYQDSSGGENWKSKNHMNRDGKIPLRINGGVVKNSNETLSHVSRPINIVAIANQKATICTAVKHFWQNFPKSIECTNERICVHLFPIEFNDLYELQGGEQKTHTMYFQFEKKIPKDFFQMVHHPLKFHIENTFYYQTLDYPKPVPFHSNISAKLTLDYQKLINIAIHGNDSFFKRRELIDEYGWRNFGDIYADHEAVFHKGDNLFISHYNNQYDSIKGSLIQFMRTGDFEWFKFGNELAAHVSDIDIYHTQQDRFQYNQGMFWHTDHHLDAATSTHRSISIKHREWKDPQYLGGGPSYSHNYSTGFLLIYWMTGEKRYKECVLKLSDNIVKGIQGPDTIVEWIYIFSKIVKKKWNSKKNHRKLEGYDEIYEFNGPGRASGNALNTLLDAFLLTKKRMYMDYSQKLISQCISPHDQIEERDLLNTELRWMYTIFLQSLGKYLDIKKEMGQLDDFFEYSRLSLLAYANWMCKNEYPYLEKPENLEFPNETWSAQEIRKADVLAHAALYAPQNLRKNFLEKSHFFFEKCIRQLKAFETKRLTRPIVLLMSNGMAYMDMVYNPKKFDDIFSKSINYSPQKIGLFNKKFRKRKVRTIIKNFSLHKELQWIKNRLYL